MLHPPVVAGSKIRLELERANRIEWPAFLAQLKAVLLRAVIPQALVMAGIVSLAVGVDAMLQAGFGATLKYSPRFPLSAAILVIEKRN
jgi:hypothetical protein